MKNKLDKITKWSRFKYDRVAFIDQYVAVKRKKHYIKMAVAYAVLVNGIRKLSERYIEAKRRKEMYLVRLLVC